jgi:hypothetical protein
MKSLNIIVSILSCFFLLLFNSTTFSQTATDTARVLTGTVMRGMPYVEPVEPQSLESKSSELIVVKSGSRKSQKVYPSDSNKENINSIDYKDTALTNAYRKSLLAYYLSMEKRNIANTATFDSVTSYYSWALKNRQQIIKRQQDTGALIFVLVSILVLSGLIFSAIQFYIALKSVKRKGALPDTSVKASLSGIEVSSSVLGVIILTLSIVFFFLYLTRVYPLVSLDQISIQASK